MTLKVTDNQFGRLS